MFEDWIVFLQGSTVMQEGGRDWNDMHIWTSGKGSVSSKYSGLMVGDCL